MMGQTMLIVVVFTVYILFAFGILFVNHRLKMEKGINLIVIVPILFSFITGAGLLMYALTKL